MESFRNIVPVILLALLTCACPRAGAVDMLDEFAETYQDPVVTRPLVTDPYSMGPVAIVGHARIGADQVFELWTPIWSETEMRVRNGKMSPQEGNARLQEEWERAIRALVKDELFFQEAEREHASFINSIVDNVMRGGADRPRNQVVTEIRRMMEQSMQRHFRLISQDQIKRSGGLVKLRKVLESRGMTINEWQARLRKKAFTQSYLHQILNPRAPSPGPRAIQTYYADHPEEFSNPGPVRFRHIFFSNAARGGEEAAREAAIDVWEMIEDGEIDFETAASEYSDDPESKDRGGLETEPEASDPEREAWLADIRAALREEEPGQLGPILESPFGCHVATLISIGAPVRIPFAEVRRTIEDKLMNEVWEAETDRYFATISRNTDIRVVMPTFPASLASGDVRRTRRGAVIYNTARPGVHSYEEGNRQ